MAAHSSLLSNERSGTTKAFILHYIFSQYPESLLNEIVYRLMHTDAVITLTKSNDIQRKISSEASTFLAGRAYHINQRYIYRWYTYMPATVLHETYSWINEHILSKIDLDDIKHPMVVNFDIEEQNNMAIAASFVTFFDSNHFDVRLALPRSLDNEPEMVAQRMNRKAHDDESNSDENDDDDDDDDDDDEDEDDQHERVFQQVLQSARRIDQTRYENINKRKISTDDEATNKKSRFKTESPSTADPSKSTASSRHQCSECSKSFLNRTSLVRHRHRQHTQHRQVKSSKSTLRPGTTQPNPLGRGRHATDTSSLSCCSIQFHLSEPFLREQFQHFFVQRSLHTIDKLIDRFPLYSAVYDQDQHMDWNDTNVLYTSIVNAHEFGLSFHQLYKHVQSSMSFGECVKQLNDYLTRGIIIAAGSRTRVYVHRKHARSWLIYSIRFRQADNNNNLETLLTSALVESSLSPSVATMDGSTASNDKRLLFSCDDKVLQKDNPLINDKFERIVFVPRPWKSTDGSINYSVLQRMMESLLLFIIDHPGANLEYLYEHYKCVLQPVAIDDCIELFQQMNCLETVQVALKRTVDQPIDLYSNESADQEEDDAGEQENAVQHDSDNDLERLLFKTNYDYRQTTLYCFPTYDCLAKFGVSFSSSSINLTGGVGRMPFPNY